MTSWLNFIILDAGNVIQNMDSTQNYLKMKKLEFFNAREIQNIDTKKEKTEFLSLFNLE